MTEKKQNLRYLEIINTSGALILISVALLILMAACSRNGASMSDKNGKGSNTSRQINSQASDQWKRIIVRLKVSDIDQLKAKAAKLKDPAASKAMDEKIARRIAKVADRVIEQLKPSSFKLIRRYETLPLLAMAVTPQAEAMLKKMPVVLGIEADSLHSPSRKTP